MTSARNRSSLEHPQAAESVRCKPGMTEGAKGMKGAIRRAEEILASDPEKYLLLQQFSDPANPETLQKTTGPRKSGKINGQVDVFIAGVGTGDFADWRHRYIKGTKGKTDIFIS
ncbi:hypothetical protein ACNKHW_15295 [Shigella flexneri]